MKKTFTVVDDNDFFSSMLAENPGMKLKQIFQRNIGEAESSREAAFVFYERCVSLETAIEEYAKECSDGLLMRDAIINRARDIDDFRAKYMHDPSTEKHAKAARAVVAAVVQATLRKRGRMAS